MASTPPQDAPEPASEALRESIQASTNTQGRSFRDRQGSYARSEQPPSSSASWKALFSFTTKGHLGPLILAGIFSILAGLTIPVQAFLLGKLINAFVQFQATTITNDVFTREVNKYSVFFVVLATINWLTAGGMMMTWMFFGELQARSARYRVFHSLLDKDIEWFDLRKSGISAFCTRMQSGISELRTATSSPFGYCTQHICTCVSSVILAMVYSWKLTLVTLATWPVAVFVLFYCSSRIEPNVRLQGQKLADAARSTNTAFSNIETVKCFNAQGSERYKYMGIISEAAEFFYRQANWTGIQASTLRLATLLMYVQGFWFGSTLVVSGEKNAGDVVTTFWSAIMATQALMEIMPIMIMLEKGKSAALRLRIVLHRNSRQMDQSGDAQLATCAGDIELKKVTFAYPTRPRQMVLRDASLFFPAGELTFVIGKSGSGKSTVGQLLAGFYRPWDGNIVLDGHPFETLDQECIRQNVTLVEQQSVLFSGTVWDNIAVGSRRFPDVDNSEVESAAEFARLSDAIDDMQEGFETAVGPKGGTMSGGQRQRMAIARAKLRDTPILILDESTSALDYINRSLVMENIRKWRHGKTTIVVTHDISQILPDDYLYILKDGEVVQEGYRGSLAAQPDSIFQSFLQDSDPAEREDQSISDVSMNREDSDTGGINIRYDEHDWSDGAIPSYLVGQFGKSSNRESMIRPHSMSPFWQLMRPINNDEPETPGSLASSRGQRGSSFFRAIERPEVLDRLIDRTRTIASSNSQRNHRFLSVMDKAAPLNLDRIDLGDEQEMEVSPPTTRPQPRTLMEILKTVWPCLGWNGRVRLFLALIGTIGYSAGTPVFAFVFSKLLATYFDPMNMQRQAKTYSLAIIGIAVGDAIFLYLQYSQFHRVGLIWVNQLREDAMRRIVSQPRDFFDKEEYNVSKLTECLDNRAEEMQYIISRFVPNVLLVAVMLSIAFVWSMVANSKLTLVALAMAPIVYGVSSLFTKTNGYHDRRYNDASESAGGILLEACSNIRTIRSLTIERYFQSKYDVAAQYAFMTGVFRAASGGVLFGLSDSTFIYVTALVFHYSAVLVSSAGARVDSILQVIMLLLFSIGNAHVIVAFVPQLSEARDAASRLMELCGLPSTSHEDEGSTRISTIGDIHFSHLNFQYPSRPCRPILRDLSFVIPSGTCTALVGSSGSGKSTVASLLLKLYGTRMAPTASGAIALSGRDIARVHTPTLRSLITVVPQNPVLLPLSLAANIAYGLHPSSPLAGRPRVHDAARAAGIHDFIANLPQGYDTLVGEGGMGLSGGQAQRVAIARALVRRPRLLVLDEATAALDVESAGIVRETVRALIAEGRAARARARAQAEGAGQRRWGTVHGVQEEEVTVLIITHARDMMSIADQIVMMEKGEVVEQGGFEELRARNGPFSKLLRGEAAE